MGSLHMQKTYGTSVGQDVMCARVNVCRRSSERSVLQMDREVLVGVASEHWWGRVHWGSPRANRRSEQVTLIVFLDLKISPLLKGYRHQYFSM